ncbi:hypothetical protein [Edwardsiella tarda]|uniref:hypothetical protein n=1 Tax=Edwardsiella tarda TaxID=636 RepID=UPI0005535B98|nr:hypothetical protein [Edwardsiella tarda]
MTTITKEFAQAIIKGHGYGVAPSAVEALARIAMAALEATASGNSVHDLFLRAKALMYQSGGSPIEHSLNPVDAWLFEAERAANKPAEPVSPAYKLPAAQQQEEER